MTPTVGRTVHYVAYGTPGGEYPAAHRAAVVTEVDAETGRVGLCILNPTGLFFTQGVRYVGSDDPQPGTWHWPERSQD